MNATPWQNVEGRPVTITLVGKTFTATVKERPAVGADRRTKAFFWNEPLPSDLGLMPTPPDDPFGENPIVQAAWAAHYTLELAIKRQVLAQVVGEGEWRYNQNAGGRYSGVPGFVSKDGREGTEYHITF